MRDVTDGVGQSGVRSGVIGEVGGPLAPHGGGAQGPASLGSGAAPHWRPAPDPPRARRAGARGDRRDPARRGRGHLADDRRPHRSDDLQSGGAQKAGGDGLRSRVRSLRPRVLVLQVRRSHRPAERRRAPPGDPLAGGRGLREPDCGGPRHGQQVSPGSATAVAATPTLSRTSCRACAGAGWSRSTSRRCWSPTPARLLAFAEPQRGA